jgi:hypothetical protein
MLKYQLSICCTPRTHIDLPTINIQIGFFLLFSRSTIILFSSAKLYHRQYLFIFFSFFLYFVFVGSSSIVFCFYITYLQLVFFLLSFIFEISSLLGLLSCSVSVSTFYICLYHNYIVFFRSFLIFFFFWFCYCHVLSLLHRLSQL